MAATLTFLHRKFSRPIRIRVEDVGEQITRCRVERTNSSCCWKILQPGDLRAIYSSQTLCKIVFVEPDNGRGTSHLPRVEQHSRWQTADDIGLSPHHPHQYVHYRSSLVLIGRSQRTTHLLHDRSQMARSRNLPALPLYYIQPLPATCHQPEHAEGTRKKRPIPRTGDC